MTKIALKNSSRENVFPKKKDFLFCQYCVFTNKSIYYSLKLYDTWCDFLRITPRQTPFVACEKFVLASNWSRTGPRQCSPCAKVLRKHAGSGKICKYTCSASRICRPQGEWADAQGRRDFRRAKACHPAALSVKSVTFCEYQSANVVKSFLEGGMS